MHDRGPLPLALREDPAAVLLVRLQRGGSPRLVAADAGALAMAGTGSLPADLLAWCRGAGFGGHGPAEQGPDGRATGGRSPGGPTPETPSPWQQLARGERIGGVLLPDHLWLTATPAGGDRVLVALQHLEGPPAAPGGQEADVVTASPGMALSERHRKVDGDGDSGESPGGADEPGGAFVVSWAGPGYTRATGTPADEVVGRPARALVRTGAETAPTELAALQRAEPVAVTVLDRRSDGTSFLHRVHTSPLLDAGGRVAHLVSWHADVTGRAAAEAGLRQARAAEERAARRLELHRHLDEVVVADDVAAGLQAVVDVLGEHVVADALVLLTVTRPGGPRGVDAELAAAAGPVLAPLTGRRLRRTGADGADDPLLRVAEAGRTHALTPPASDPQEAATASAWVAGMVAAVTATPAVAVPMLGRDQVVGLLVVLPRDGVELSEDEAVVVVGAARRAGLLVETARSHAREHALAETLQRSMLPQQATVDGLDVWTYYAPNVDRAQVGGDWYDVLQTSPDVAAVVIGDVVGHDVEAVAAMSQIRSVVRSYAHELDDPGSVLMRVDQLASGMRIPRMASLVYAMLSRLDDGGWELSWSSAGHLPPLLRRGGPGAAGVEVLSDGTGTLVGLGNRPRPTRDRSLAPGDVLVFYTDGLIETRERAMRDGLGVLVGVLETAKAADAAGIGEELLTALGESPDDDTAVVVVRIPDEVAAEPAHPADTPRRRRWQLPSEPSSIGKGRHATLRACAVWGLHCGPQAEIVVSELVANAVLHGWGTVGLRLFETPEGLRIEVEDDSPEAPRVVDARPDGSGGHGMRVVSRLGRWGWQPTRKGKIVWVELDSPAD